MSQVSSKTSLSLKASRASDTYPITLQGRSKTSLRCQFAALCLRSSNQEQEVCLITSRTTKRWILPKGWPMDGKTPQQAAQIEAWEEAGLKGDMGAQIIGTYSYIKDVKGKPRTILALIYPLYVETQHERWPEHKQRTRQWFALKDAAKHVKEPELKAILKALA